MAEAQNWIQTLCDSSEMKRLRYGIARLSEQWRQERRSLSFKLTVLLTGTIAASVGATSLFYIDRELRNARTELQEEANLLLDILEVTLEDPLSQLDAEFLKDFMRDLGQDRTLLVSGSVYDAQGRLIADLNSDEVFSEVTADPIGGQLLNQSTTAVEWRDGELLAVRGVIVDDKSLGAIQVGLSTQSLSQRLTDVRNRGLVIIFLSPFLAIPLAQWLSLYITRPIQTLVKGTRRLAQGRFNQLVSVETDDELAILAEAFNQMGLQLKSNLDLLETKNTDLQKQTVALKQTLNELQETQGQLIQSEKMSSLGQLVAGIAHEVNNPINFVHGNLTYLREYSEDVLTLLALYQKYYPRPPLEISDKLANIDLSFVVEDMTNILQSMDMGTLRIRDIVSSLRNFSRLDESNQKYVNVHDGIDSTLMILRHRLKGNKFRPAIRIKKNYGDIPVIACYPGQLNQVFMNLLANAIDILDEVSERSSPTESAENPKEIEIRTEYFPYLNPPVITVEIEDNGPGIPEDIGSKLFDPFFTTKPVGKGTGLGLSISYRIITEQHQGKLSYRSLPGEGTAFIVQLPVVEEDEMAA